MLIWNSPFLFLSVRMRRTLLERNPVVQELNCQAAQLTGLVHFLVSILKKKKMTTYLKNGHWL